MSINIFGNEIPLYGVFFWLGIFVAAISAIFISKKKKLPLFDLTCSAVYTMIMAMIGAKLLYLIVSFDEIISFAERNNLTFLELLPMIIKGGFVFYGGLIGGVGGLLIYAKQFKMDRWQLLDIYAAVLPLGHAIGRIGCFLGGCCYGIAYDGPLSHVYETPTGTAPVGVALFPVQLLEALCLLILFGTQILLLFKSKDKKRVLVYNYIFSYSVIRFALEFLRGDSERGALFIFSTSQWISLSVSIIMLVVICRKYKLEKSENNEKTDK